MRDHRQLIAFVKARELALGVYKATSGFPPEERFGLASQIRRSAVSVPSNLVEGCARRSEQDFLRFVDIALGSARELEFQLDLAQQLGFLGENGSLIGLSQEVARLVTGLANSFNKTPASASRPSDDGR
ncbi:MAG TPA: four helix bundle protein [Geothrix sp.]|jgi:four helix bundle protein